MKVTSIIIQNFRKLLECRIDISEGTTLFVGANNSGKTSAMDALAKFLANRSFVFNDITISRRTEFPAVFKRTIYNFKLPRRSSKKLGNIDCI